MISLLRTIYGVNFTLNNLALGVQIQYKAHKNRKYHTKKQMKEKKLNEIACIPKEPVLNALKKNTLKKHFFKQNLNHIFFSVLGILFRS